MPAPTLGFILPNSGPLATAQNIELVAQRAESHGLDAVWIGDHIVMPRQVASRYPYAADGAWPANPEYPCFEPLMTLAYVAGHSARLRLGLSVLIVPYRNPVVTAKMLATLDTLSRGRLTIGCGVGWLQEEFQALGLSTFPRRGEVTDEFLRAFKVLWTERSPSFSGQFYQFANITCDPKPVQKPHPPLWIGGNTDRALRRAAALGDGWQAIRVDQPTFAAKVRRLQELATRQGRDPRTLTVSLRVVIDPFGSGPANPGDGRAPLSGPTEALVEGLRQYVAAGAQDLVLEFRRNLLTSIASGLEVVDWVASELKPRLATS
ncbi:MAG: LLM class F420-dependent oxidoreductase [Chloroflexi bacterium]|nr:LLM class F420-dependent oxidoreductase [Chloroflexota bacterium]MBI4505294.1 LLM class F420-dependent oxidoreductase [Chloroflexota bacterium]